MARKTTPPVADPDPELRVTPEVAEQKIAERIAQGQELGERSITTGAQLEAAQNDFSRWDSYNVELIRRLFTAPKFADEYSRWGSVVMSMYEKSPQEKLEDLKTDISEKIHRLESLRDRLELIPVAAGVARTPDPAPTRERTNKVFVVHGHDEAARESVARFLERLGIGAVILHEQASGGRTIVEKLEHYGNVDFAVVLLTPDDIGTTKSESEDNLQARARQNVILELGFFVGRLGRQHVCALYKGPLELPSDYLGVGYVSLDEAGGWRLQLAKELRSAGFDVDMNLAV